MSRRCGDRQTLVRVMSHSVAGPSLKPALRCGSQAGARVHAQACWEIQETAKLYKLQKEREKELKGKVSDACTHAHTDTHMDGTGMTHERFQAKSNKLSVERRECD